MLLALIMLVILAVSSVTVEWGRRQSKKGNEGTARAALIATMLLGLAFLLLQAREYRTHLKTLLPTTDAYGSIFYTITSVHGVHLLLGLLMLGYVAMLPEVCPGRRPPHRPVHTVSLYWHFVDAAWFLIVGLLYVLPNLQWRLSS